jgi:nitrile hydratase accessory protein
MAANLTPFEDLPRLPRDAEGPVFAEPWQAQAFALTVRLHEAGHFSWSEWTAALAAQLRDAAERGQTDQDAAQYYHHWLAALEGLAIAKGLTDIAALHRRKHAWADAYRATPHGQPVELKASGVTSSGPRAAPGTAASRPRARA